MARVTVRGGRKLQRFFDRAAALTNARYARIIARVLQRVLIPALRSRVPNRTGKLRNSLRIVARGESVQLRGAFYGQFARVGPGRDTVAELAMDIMQSRASEIRERVKAEVRKELGI